MQTTKNQNKWPIFGKSEFRPYSECAKEKKHPENKEKYTLAHAVTTAMITHHHKKKLENKKTGANYSTGSSKREVCKNKKCVTITLASISL